VFINIPSAALIVLSVLDLEMDSRTTNSQYKPHCYSNRKCIAWMSSRVKQNCTYLWHL